MAPSGTARGFDLGGGRTERERIAEAISRAGGNASRAARELGISRATLYRKMRE